VIVEACQVANDTECSRVLFYIMFHGEYSVVIIRGGDVKIRNTYPVQHRSNYNITIIMGS